MTTKAGMGKMWRTQARWNRALSEHSQHPITRANLLHAAENYEARARHADDRDNLSTALVKIDQPNG
jgi:hypothetical protein